MKTSTLLRIYKITTCVLLGVLALMPLIYSRNTFFASFATLAITLVLIVIAFQVQRLRMLSALLAKLDELLELLRNSRREVSVAESNQITRELQEMRAVLLRDTLLDLKNPHDFNKI